MITVNPYSWDSKLARAVNQYYYRSDAVANLIKQLTELDPTSIIIVLSDHLPPLTKGTETYEELNYLNNIDNSIFYNRIIIVEGGEIKHYGILHHFLVPELILNYLTEGTYCNKYDCAFLKEDADLDKSVYEEDYFKIMAHGAL